MSLAATLPTDANRPPSFLPAVKCSDCGREIEIAAMGEHVCSTRHDLDASGTAYSAQHQDWPYPGDDGASVRWTTALHTELQPSQPQVETETNLWIDSPRTDRKHERFAQTNPYTMSNSSSSQQLEIESRQIAGTDPYAIPDASPSRQQMNWSFVPPQHHHRQPVKQEMDNAYFGKPDPDLLKEVDDRQMARNAPPSIDSFAANSHFLSPQPNRPITPSSPSTSTRSARNPPSRPLPTRTISARPRLFDPHPPSPELSANLDCAFPPFPVAKPSRPSTANGRRTPSQRAPSRSSSRHAAKIHPGVFLEPKSPKYRGVGDKSNVPKNDSSDYALDQSAEPYSIASPFSSPSRNEVEIHVEAFPLPPVATIAALDEDIKLANGNSESHSNHPRSTLQPQGYMDSASQSVRDSQEMSSRFLTENLSEVTIPPSPDPRHQQTTASSGNGYGARTPPGRDEIHLQDQQDSLGKTPNKPISSDGKTLESTPMTANESIIGPIYGFHFNDSPVASPERPRVGTSHESLYSSSSNSSRRPGSNGGSDAQLSPMTSTANSLDVSAGIQLGGRANRDARNNSIAMGVENNSRSPPRNFTRPSWPRPFEDYTNMDTHARMGESKQALDSAMDPALHIKLLEIAQDPFHKPELPPPISKTAITPSMPSESIYVRTPDFPAPPPEPSVANTELTFPARGSSLRDPTRQRSKSNAASRHRPPGFNEFSRAGTFPNHASTHPYRGDHDAISPHLMRRPTVGRPICRGCGLQIEGKSVKAADGRLTGRWHKLCFTCKTCEQPFTTADFYVLNNQPYCEHHYHEKNGSLCHGCNRGIEGSYLEATSHTRHGTFDYKYHRRCFTCSQCRLVLSDDYFEISGRVYCERHAQTAMHTQGRVDSNLGGLVPTDRRGLHAERRTTRLMMMGPTV